VEKLQRTGATGASGSPNSVQPIKLSPCKGAPRGKGLTGKKDTEKKKPGRYEGKAVVVVQDSAKARFRCGGKENVKVH